ncbi:MAG: methyltransferase domain-containing protein [bacterium]|nr:methyltransferase domain-containing protein [bacterium]
MTDRYRDLPAGDSGQPLEHALNLYGARCETEWLRDRNEQGHKSEFLERGVFVKYIPDDVVDGLRGFVAEDRAAPFSVSDCKPGYLRSDLQMDTERILNAQNRYYPPPDSFASRVLEEFLGSMEDEIEMQLAHPWRVVNVRAWSAMPGGSEGPNAWHFDGFSRYVRKLMFFLCPPNYANGSFEMLTRGGEFVRLEETRPVCALIDPSVLLHRGRPSPQDLRPIIEVLIVPANETSSVCVFAGQNARVPLDCAGDVVRELEATKFVPPAPSVTQRPNLLRRMRKASKKLRKRLKKRTRTRTELPVITNLSGRVNLGGGPHFQSPGWINLEAAPSILNPFPFTFDERAVFPVPSSSVKLVYSSHCLEHLNDATVDRTLDEARRVIRSDGTLLLKIPDFDRALDCWRSGDPSFFGEQWDFEAVSTTWPSRKVADCLDSRAAMVFCGFWNDVYGDHFSKDRRDGSDAYHGPPTQIAAMRDDLLALDSPHEIASRLRTAVVDREPSYVFNHQNAWSRQEFRKLLESHGFRVESFDATELKQHFLDVPGIREMEDISTFCLASPA